MKTTMNYPKSLLILAVLVALSACDRPSVKVVFIPTEKLFYEEIYLLEDETVVWAIEGPNGKISRKKYDANVWDDKIEIKTPDGVHTLYRYLLENEVIWIPTQVYLAMKEKPRTEWNEFLRESLFFRESNSGKLGGY